MGQGELMTAKSYIAALTIFLVISGPAFSVGASPLAEGQHQFSLENYEEAALLLEKSRAANLSDQTVVRMLGLTYFNILKYEKALPLLRQARLTDRDDLVVHYALADVYLGMLMLDEAGESIGQLEEGQADDWRTRMSRGRLCLVEGKTQCAIEGLTDGARLHPPIACRAALDLVDLYVDRGELKRAEEVARAALKAAPEAFEVVELGKKLEQLLVSGNQVGEKQKAYRLHLGYRLELDNYLLVDSAAPLPQPEEDWRHVFSAGLSGYRPLENEKHLYGEMRLYHSSHNEMSTFDQGQFYGLGGVKWVMGRYMFRLPVEYVWSSLDDDYYHSSLSLVPDVGFKLGRTSTLYGLFRYQEDSYPDQVRAAEKRSGHKHRLGLMWRGAFSGQRGWFSTYVARIETSGAGNNWNYDELQISGRLTFQFSKRWAGSLTLMYGDQQFADLHDIYLLYRHDRYYQWLPELTYRWTKQWSLKLHGVVIDRDSSIADYSYDRQVVGLGMNFHY